MDVFKLTARFNKEILGLVKPPVPTRLDMTRADWFFKAAQEELNEFMLSETLEDDVDAILDLIYFSAGRLYEMGVDPDPIFQAIHDANMKKVKGELAKRPGSKGYDAIKPAGWTAPDVGAIIAKQRKPKLIIIGHGRHGKDTVAEMIAEHYGLKFTSSSLFCSERLIYPLVTTTTFDWDNMLREMEDMDLYNRMLGELRTMSAKGYGSPEECFNDRHNHRELWFQAIKWFCQPKDRLAREILEVNDIYCGIRAQDELFAARDANIADAIVWVDAGKRLPPEPEGSMQLTADMATHFIDNNGAMSDLELQVISLMEGLNG